MAGLKDHTTIIYVCFGSGCVFVTDQIHEFAWGLEVAGYPFVWALRSEDIVLADGFERSTRGKG